LCELMSHARPRNTAIPSRLIRRGGMAQSELVTR
jgi:hypothetical protein